MGFFNRIYWVFAAPTRLFADIKEGRASWWQAWIWLSIIYLVVGYFSMPINLALIEVNPQDLPPDQLDQQLAFFEGPLKWVQVAASPLIILVVSLIVSALAYIVVSILSEKANFKQFFALSLYASVVSSMANVLTTIVVLMRGVDTIRAVADAKFSVGLGFLAPEEGALIRALLGSFDFFAIWSFVLVVMGLMYLFELTRRQAIVCIVPLWVIYVGMLFLGEITGSFG